MAKKKNAWVISALSLELEGKKAKGHVVLGLLPARAKIKDIERHVQSLYRMFRLDSSTQLQTLNIRGHNSLSTVIATRSGCSIGSNKFFIFAEHAEIISLENNILEWKIPGTPPDVKIAVPDYPVTETEIKKASFASLKIFG